MVLNQVYRKSPEATVNYSFSDAVRKTGYIRFYLAKDHGGGGILTTNATASDTIHTAIGGVGTVSVDFDVEFKTAQILKGLCYVSIPTADIDTGSGVNTYRVDATLKKVSDTTTTLFALSGNGISGEGGKRTYTLLKGDISKTKFANGNTLRLSVDLVVTGAAAGAPVIAFGHDPQGADREGVATGELNWASGDHGGVSSTSFIDVPFQVRL